MTAVAYGIAMPASRGVLSAQPRAPLDGIADVTITAAYSIDQLLLTSFGSGKRFRVRDTTTAGEQDCETPAAATAFLAGNGGAVVSTYNQTGVTRTLTNAHRRPAAGLYRGGGCSQSRGGGV